MSNRVFRKLVRNEESSIGYIPDADKDKGSSFDNDELIEEKTSKPINRFELLTVLDSDCPSHYEAKDDGDSLSDLNSENNDKDQDRSSRQADSTQHSTAEISKRKKKRKKKSKKAKDPGVSSQDEIDVGLREVEKLIGSVEIQGCSSTEQSKKKIEKNLLAVEGRHLNPENELKRFFGSKVILAEMTPSRRRNPKGRLTVRPWTLINSRNVPIISRPPFSMELSHTSENNLYYFYFSHSKSYQSIQHQFLEIIETSNLDALSNLISIHPYLVDALLQFSDICEVMGENQTAAVLIERALHCFEMVFHPLFNISQANCRLDYKRAENRPFFVALFRHIHFIGLKGLNRTAVEFCKLLYSLDPDLDPLCVLCCIDYYALRSEQYDFMLQFYEEMKESKKLFLLPNWRYSIALALYYRAEAKKGDMEMVKNANIALQEALADFPNFLIPLLDKCSVEPDKEVLKFFGKIGSVPSFLNDLVQIYLTRSHILWNKREIIHWLEFNVKEVVKNLEENYCYLEKCKERWNKYYSCASPKNVLRHIILSHMSELIARLPPEIKSHSITAFDPLPPTDSISGYRKPLKKERNASADQSSLFSTFFHSMLPNFNLEELNRTLAVAEPQREGQPAQDHTGESFLSNNELRRSLTTLFDAMRDLMSVFDPTDGQNEGDIESGNDNPSDSGSNR